MDHINQEGGWWSWMGCQRFGPQSKAAVDDINPVTFPDLVSCQKRPKSQVAHCKQKFRPLNPHSYPTCSPNPTHKTKKNQPSTHNEISMTMQIKHTFFRLFHGIIIYNNK